MKVLIACEFSGTVRDAFARRGHNAWSCDLLQTEKPGQHIQGDVLNYLSEGWDLMVAHPPCTYLCLSGNRWFKSAYVARYPDRRQQRLAAIEFARALWNAPIPRIAMENPRSVLSTQLCRYHQEIQPYQYGHPDRKTTWLWLKNLPPLKPTAVIEPRIKRNRNGKTASVHHDEALRVHYSDRWKVRSRTYDGIAEAMAEQWGNPDYEAAVIEQLPLFAELEVAA